MGNKWAENRDILSNGFWRILPNDKLDILNYFKK